MQWIAENWHGLFSVGAMILGVGASLAHMLHKDDVSKKLKAMEELLEDMSKNKSVPPQS